MPRSQPTPKVKGSLAVSSSLSGLSKVLLTLILFLLPTQLGYHFWPDASLVYGVRIDYLSPTLYFLDILIAVYLILIYKVSPRKLVIDNWLLIILLANLLFSSNPLSTLSWSLHLMLYALFALSLNFSDIRYTINKILLLSSLFQLTLASLQVYLNHSLQGPLYYLGERMVSVGQPGVALTTFMDNIILRAYGTFGHPNVLAGWLLIVSLIVYKLISPISLIPYSLFLLPFLGILLTQSRAAALAYFGVIIPFYLIKNIKSRFIYFVFLLTTVYSLLSTPTIQRSFDLSLTERLDLQQLSFQVIQRYPLFGTGANASLTTYPEVSPNVRLLQPDHNGFTLLLSWFGIIGVIVVVYSLRLRLITYLLFLIPIAPILVLDHYLLTSPQGLLILLLYLRVTINHKP